jgi:hypothetical protein
MHARTCGFAKPAVVSRNSHEQGQRYRAVNRSAPAIPRFREREDGIRIATCRFRSIRPRPRPVNAGNFYGDNAWRDGAFPVNA